MLPLGAGNFIFSASLAIIFSWGKIMLYFNYLYENVPVAYHVSPNKPMNFPTNNSANNSGSSSNNANMNKPTSSNTQTNNKIDNSDRELASLVADTHNL